MGHASATTTLRHNRHVFDESRLAPATPMVEAIRAARAEIAGSNLGNRLQKRDRAGGADPRDPPNVDGEWRVRVGLRPSEVSHRDQSLRPPDAAAILERRGAPGGCGAPQVEQATGLL